MTRLFFLPALAACLLAGTPTEARDCRLVDAVIVVDLRNQAHARILDHVWDAVRAGQPAVLHIDREGAEENRREALKGISTKPGFDRDEYPGAIAREGGAGASVRYVRSAENRSAGSVMGAQLRGFCDSQAWRFERW